MSSVHFLNVGKGDCTLIQHECGNNTVVDICKGNYTPPDEETRTLESIFAGLVSAKSGDYGMSEKPTNPITYFRGLGVKSLFRFILTHPDMDHLDGFAALQAAFPIANLWDSGVTKTKPDFGENCGYVEADWDRYQQILAGDQGTTIIRQLAGARFQQANLRADGKPGGDGLYILAPDKALVDLANKGEDVNDGSYVLLYRSPGGRILIPGDAHDETWDYVIKHYRADVENCSVLFAPHHGRKSGRDFKFLDVIKPQVTFFGCASSGHLAYNAWSSRNLPVVTNNQAGNIVLESTAGHIKVYVENKTFAEAMGCNVSVVNASGYVLLHTIPEIAEKAAASSASVLAAL